MTHSSVFARLNAISIAVAVVLVVRPLEATERGIVRFRNVIRRYAGLPPVSCRWSAQRNQKEDKS